MGTLAPVPKPNEVTIASRLVSSVWFNWFNTVRAFMLGTDGPIRAGTGDPNGAIVGTVGDLWRRTDGGAGSTLYVKESGNQTNTGWAAK
jgi:hypothetical protein